MITLYLCSSSVAYSYRNIIHMSSFIKLTVVMERTLKEIFHYYKQQKRKGKKLLKFPRKPLNSRKKPNWGGYIDSSNFI